VAEQDRKGVFGGEEEGGGVRSGPGEARTILLLHIISVRPSKQPLMVRTFLKVYMELGSYFLLLQEQIKDIIINKAFFFLKSFFFTTITSTI
jgi:GTPase involved in cell partitioning and DNA repair